MPRYGSYTGPRARPPRPEALYPSRRATCGSRSGSWRRAAELAGDSRWLCGGLNSRILQQSQGGDYLRRFSLSLLALVGITAAVGVTGATGTPAPTCLGKCATITGSGSLSGTAGNDVIVGSESCRRDDSKGGDDLICGLGGDDVLIGGLGTDQTTRAPATTSSLATCRQGGAQAPGPDPGVSGDAVGGGNDRLFGGDGGDIISGDSFSPNDDAVGGGNDEIFGGDGLDRIAGDSNTKGGTATGGGNDLIVGGSGDDSLVGDSHSLFLLGVVSGAGNDVLLGGPGIDGLIGDSEGLSASGAGRQRHRRPGSRWWRVCNRRPCGPRERKRSGNDKIGGSVEPPRSGDIVPSGRTASSSTRSSRGGTNASVEAHTRTVRSTQ